MDFLRKIGQACRQHYEKILLTLALLGLAGAVWYLNEQRKSEEKKIANFLQDVARREKGTLPPINFSGYDAVLKQVQRPPSLNFSLPHNLLNPVKWQRRPNNELIKVQTGEEVGWPQMVVTRITPLNFIVTLNRAPSAAGCFLSLTREAADRPVDRKPKQIYATLNATNRFFDKYFVLREIKESAGEASLEMLDGNEKVTVSTNQPHVKVEGYEAELKYNVDGKTFPNLRVGSTIRFLSDAYNIVAITPTEVVASAQLNDKKYSVPVRASAAKP